MTEILTDELLDVLYPKYRFYVDICKFSGMQPSTFDEFVNKQLEIRQFKMRKLKERGIYVK